MKTMKKAVWAIWMMLTAMVMGVITSCTDQDVEIYESRSTLPGPDPEGDYRVARAFNLTCVPQEQRVDHTGKSFITFYEGESLEPVQEFEKTLLSWAKISLAPDTVRIGEDAEKPYQTAISIDRSYKGGVETDNVIISVSDGRVITVKYEAAHATPSEFNGKSYAHGHDSLVSARMLTPENLPLTKASSQYVKEIYITKYPVEVTTQGYTGDGKKYGNADLDTLYAYGITKVLADNDTEVKKTGTGVKVINETQQRDSVVITKTWSDGHSERMVFNTILNRWLKNIARREVDVNSFDGQSAGSSFSRVEGAESLVRSDVNWRVYGRTVTITKMVSVNGHAEEITYTFYQERAEFFYEGISHLFPYVDWQVHNYADTFKNVISTKENYDEMDYQNEIQTYYLDYVQMADEAIAWFKAVAGIDHYEVVNAKREDFTTYTYVYLEKVAVYTDGTSKKVGQFSAKLPITVVPKTNWVYRTDSYGTYVANDFSLTQTGKTASSAEKFFFYNRYAYLFGNVVSGIGQKNEGEAIVPNDIVFKDGDVEHTFTNTSLVVTKKAENTRKSGSEAGVDTYAYTCTAGVTFGASQEVSLPGTILVDSRSHEHGKVSEVHFTTTENENRSSYLSVCVIVFEDGYRSVGKTGNGDTDFSFTLSSRTDGINSAVWNGNWIPAKAEDMPGEGCMVWFDESGKDIRSYSYVKGNRNGWNNGNNTVKDPRRKGEISEDGYSVTFYLNGQKGKTLVF